MSDLIFGIIWLTFSVLMSIPFFISFGKSGMIGSVFFLVFFFAIFYAVGIYMIYRGAKRVRRDKKTEEFGVQTFGKVIGIQRTGTYVNGNPELKAEIAAYSPYERKVNTYTEVIGFAPAKFRRGEYLRLKVYLDDVNIIASVAERDVPLEQLEEINFAFPTTDNSKDELYIDGVKYVRAPNQNQSNEYKYDSEW